MVLHVLYIVSEAYFRSLKSGRSPDPGAEPRDGGSDFQEEEGADSFIFPGGVVSQMSSEDLSESVFICVQVLLFSAFSAALCGDIFHYFVHRSLSSRRPFSWSSVRTFSRMCLELRNSPSLNFIASRPLFSSFMDSVKLTFG